MVGRVVSSGEQVSIGQAVQLTGMHENTIRRFIKKARATDPKARTKIIRTRRGYQLDRAYLLAGMGQEPPAAKPTQDQPQQKRQTEKITIWAKPAVKHELQLIADRAGLSQSRTGGAALEEWLSLRSHRQHAGIFQPMIEHAIAKEMHAYSSRIALLLVRSVFSMEQTRGLVRNILGRQPGVTEPLLIPIRVLRDHSKMREVSHRAETLRVGFQLIQSITHLVNHGIKRGKSEIRELFFA